MPIAAVIRAATAGDIPVLAALVRRYWDFEGIDDFDDDRCRRTLELFFRTPGLGAAWLARDGDRAAGYLIACYVFSLEHGGLTAEIDELFLLPSYRSGGLGRQLLETAEAEFRRAGCTNVSLQLGPGNERGRRFYVRSGYRPRLYELLDKML